MIRKLFYGQVDVVSSSCLDKSLVVSVLAVLLLLLIGQNRLRAMPQC